MRIVSVARKRLIVIGLGLTSLASTAQTTPSDLLDSASRVNRFIGADNRPWHLRATYSSLNEAGKTKDTGTYELFWAGPRQIKQSFTSKTFSQTDYTTETGLLRSGDKEWPAIVDQRVFDNLFIMIPPKDALANFSLNASDRSILGTALHCIEIQPRAGALMQNPPTFCFDPGSPNLRYTSGLGRNVIEQQSSTLRNSLILFRGHQVSRDIAVACQDQPSMKVHIDILEDLPPNSDDLLKPSPDAVAPPPARQYVDQFHMAPRILKKSAPAFGFSNQSSLYVRGMLDVLIGKDGKVKDVRSVAGPDLYEASEVRSAWKTTYQPVLVNGAPVEVETEVGYMFTPH